jgi:peptide/nickel transport system substrate-binding protein
MAEAGFKDGFDVDLAAYRERHQTEALIGYLKAVGIRANLKFMQYAAMRDQVRGTRSAWRTRPGGRSRSTIFRPRHRCTSNSCLMTSTGIPRCATCCRRAIPSVDPATRKAAYAKALGLITERALSVPLFFLTTYYVASGDLTFTAYADEMPRFWEMSWK